MSLFLNKADDILSRFGYDLLVKDIWEKDVKKLAIAYEAGYEVLTLWEDDINDGSYKDALWSYLGLNLSKR